MSSPDLSPHPLPDVTQLAAWLAATDIHLLEFRSPAGKLSLRRGTGKHPMEELPSPTPAVPAPTQAVRVHASSPGHFLTAWPGCPVPLAEAGDVVAVGQMLGLVQIGALLLPVRAPRAGVLATLPATLGELVGFGSLLATLTSTIDDGQETP